MKVYFIFILIFYSSIVKADPVQDLDKRLDQPSLDFALQPKTYDPNKTNKQRFINSPCYSELGFNPFMNRVEQESMYRKCEEGKRNGSIRKGLTGVLKITGISILLVVVFFAISDSRKRYY